MKFDRVTHRDIPAIIGLFKLAYPAAWKKTGRKFNPKNVSSSLRKAMKKDILIKNEQSGQLIAFGWAGKNTDLLGNRFGEIKLILVHPDVQNRKVGTGILGYLEKKLKQRDLRLFVLSFNKVQKLYKRKGYSVFGVQMRKS